MNPLLSSQIRQLAFALLAFCSVHAANAAQAAQTTQPTPKVGDAFGDWVFSCAALAENRTACALTQTIAAKKTNKRIARFSIEHGSKKGTTMLTVVLPLGIHLPSGVNGTVDQGRPFQYTVEKCVQQGCIATYAVDSGLLKSLKSGQRLGVSFNFIPGKPPITIEGSLVGLADGLKAARLD